MQLILLTFGLLMNSSSVTFAQPSERLGSADRIRISWREFSTKTPGTYAALIVAKVCAGERSSSQVSCLPLGEFRSERLTVGDDQPIDIKQNSAWISGEAFNNMVEKITFGLSDPVVRIQIGFSAGPANFAPAGVELTYAPLPDPASANARGIAQGKVILKGSGFRTRLLIELERSRI